MANPLYANPVSGIEVPEYDYIALSNYVAGGPQSIVYKRGGVNGDTVATLTLTYDGAGNITSVAKG